MRMCISIGGGPLAMPIRLLVAEDQAEAETRQIETRAKRTSLSKSGH